MARQGYDLQLTRYDEKGWRATFYTTGMEHLADERDGHRVGTAIVDVMIVAWPPFREHGHSGHPSFDDQGSELCSVTVDEGRRQNKDGPGPSLLCSVQGTVEILHDPSS